MTDQEDDSAGTNPFGPFIRLTEASIQVWGDVINRVVGSRPFAQAMGQQMDFYLELTRIVREQTRATVEFTMQQMGLPLGKQIDNLAERVTYLEMRVDDMDAKLDDLLDVMRGAEERQPAPKKQTIKKDTKAKDP